MPAVRSAAVGREHLRFAPNAAPARRVSDEFTVPLCRLQHRALHRRGGANRQGLTAEAVISGLEDLEDYKAFEAPIIAEYDPVEREPRSCGGAVARFSSESGLSAIQAEIVRDRRRRNDRTGAARLERPFPRLINGATDSSRGNGSDNLAHTGVEQYRRDCPETLLEKPIDCTRLLTHTFLRLANLESGAFGSSTATRLPFGAKTCRQ
jgi:hypothetical protein